MRSLAGLSLAVLAAFVASASAKKGDAVIVLDSDNFDELTSEGEWIIEFYAPWCGHCKSFAPTYSKVAKALEGEVFVGKVDGSANRALSVRFGVGGFPTFFHVKGNEVRPYEFGRTEDALVRFARGGWKKVAPNTSITSPNGPVFRSLGFLLRLGSDVANLAGPIAEATGLPEMGVQFTFVLLLLLAVSATIVGCALWFPINPKRKTH